MINHVAIRPEHKGFRHVGGTQPAGDRQTVIEQGGKLNRIFLYERAGLRAGHGLAGKDTEEFNGVRVLGGGDTIQLRDVTLGNGAFRPEKNEDDRPGSRRFAQPADLAPEIRRATHAEEIVTRFGRRQQSDGEEQQEETLLHARKECRTIGRCARISEDWPIAKSFHTEQPLR